MIFLLFLTADSLKCISCGKFAWWHFYEKKIEDQRASPVYETVTRFLS